MKRRLVTLAGIAALFAGAFAGNRQLAGASPVAWFDTINEEDEVRQCLVRDSCTLTGIGTSIPGLVHGVAWVELRSLLEWSGLDLEGAHTFFQIADALAVVLVYELAAHLAGPLAGATAVWIYARDLGTLGVRSAALHNQSVLPFLGAVLLLACAAVIERPGFGSMALAALVAAVMANVHLACILTGVSVVWVALSAARHRLRLALFGAGLFAAATFAIAPTCWMQNVAQLLQHREASAAMRVGTAVPDNEVVYWVRIATIAWALSFLVRTPSAVEYRRRTQSALGIAVPFLTAFLVAPSFGVDASMKYLAHLKAACAVAAAMPVGLLTAVVIRRRGGLISSFGQLMPFVMALIVARPSPNAVPITDETLPTIADLRAVVRILRDQHGWNGDRILESLKAPQGTLVLTQVRQLASPGDEVRSAGRDVDAVALLLSLYADELPQPLPSNWTVIRQSSHVVSVLIVMPSRVDWSRFEICTRQADATEPRCVESGLRFEGAGPNFTIPNMPPGSMRVPGPFQLRLHLRSPRVGSAETIFMPRMPEVCGGRIVTTAGHVSQIEPDGRRATLPENSSDPTIEIEWNVLSPECDGTAYDGMPPFFLEGDDEDVRLLEGIFRLRENRSAPPL